LIELNARIAFTKGAHTVGDSALTTFGKENTGSNQKKRKKVEGCIRVSKFFAS
jgi:hypothetical protein